MKKDKPQEGMEFTLEKSNAPVQPIVNLPDPFAGVPPIFCADKEIAKKLLVDIFAVIGILRGIDEGKIDKKMMSKVLVNSQIVLSNLGDIMIRDCGITDADLEEISAIFQNAEQNAATPDAEIPPHK